MDTDVKYAVKQVFDNYLVSNGYHKTPERYAILDAVYDFVGHFSLFELQESLENSNFMVSKGTIYNTLRLLIGLRLVAQYRIQGVSKYEACYGKTNKCYQVCSVCGRINEIKIPAIAKIVGSVKTKRFHKDSFSLYIYGICSNCQAKQTRHKTIGRTHKNNG